MATSDSFSEHFRGSRSNPTGTLRTLQGPVWAFLMRRMINPLMRVALAGRRHAWLGSSTLMVLNFKGRRSGTPYSLPIGYQQEGSTLFGYTPFGWWRNLEGGVPVTVVLRGKTMAGMADVNTDTASVADGMVRYFRHNPGDARFFKVSLDRDKNPNREDVARAATENVQIRVDLDPDDQH